MSPADDPLNPGRHLLGPHVVGKRVVVRHLLPDGRATDVLGVCTAWADGVCEVDGDRGRVSIRVDRIVSGKPVPPRPSVRARVSARAVELRVARLWEGVETVGLGDWQLRSQPVLSGRLVKRANSCLAFGDPGLPLPDALARVVAFYAERDRPALLQVEEGGDVEAAAVAAGWVDLDPPTGNELRLGSVAQVRRALRTARTAPPVTLEATGDRATASAGTGCDPYAEASATLEGDWVGLHTITVEPAYRRRGLATALVAELLDWAAERGAMTVWLQVEPGNAPAVALWDRLGLRPHHRSRYLTRHAA